MTANKRLMEFYSGEFDVEDLTLSRINAQMQFLKAVKKHAPEILDHLRQDALLRFYEAKLHESHWRIMPVYWLEVLTLGKGGTVEDVITEHSEFLKSRGYSINPNKKSLQELTKHLTPLATSLNDWSRANGLDSDWCRARAFFTLAQWIHNETKTAFSDYTEARKAVNHWSYNHPDISVPFEFEDFTFSWAWHPGRTSRSTITRIIRKRFAEELREYLDKTAASFKDQTGIKTRLKTKQRDEHFHWLVLFQVKKMSYSEIVGLSKKPRAYLSDDTKTVRKAVNDLARFIDLPLRKDATRPGRRPSKRP